jgi:hyperosmotically inducible periplasmic protein
MTIAMNGWFRNKGRKFEMSLKNLAVGAGKSLFQSYQDEDPQMSNVKNDTMILPGSGFERVGGLLGPRDQHAIENSDKWILMKVKASLLFHRNVSASKTKVSVKEGVVTLGGQAGTEAQKELTAEYVQDVPGVKEVINDLHVVKGALDTETIGQIIDDASLTAQVKISLLGHRSTSLLNTEVVTKGGVVTLKGKAENAAEKDLVSKLAADIKGVVRVVNNMQLPTPISKS